MSTNTDSGSGRRPLASSLEMPDTCLGRHHDSGTGDLGTPAQVEVLPHGEDVGVEPAELGEEIGAHQGATAGGEEDVADGVVLTVVDFARIDPVDHGSPFVHRHADMEQPAGVVPAHQLRGHDPGVRPVGLLDQKVDGVGCGGHVVVAEEEVGRPLDHGEDLVGARPEAAVLSQQAHECPRKLRRHNGRRILGTSGVEDQDRQLGILLGGEGAQRLGEPGSRDRTSRSLRRPEEPGSPSGVRGYLRPPWSPRVSPGRSVQGVARRPWSAGGRQDPRSPPPSSGGNRSHGLACDLGGIATLGSAGADEDLNDEDCAKSSKT